jgi:beta-galactosidase
MARLALSALALAVTLVASPPAPAQQPAGPRHTFAVGDSAFLLDGRPFLIRSGEMHVSRIPRAYWRQRIQMAHAMGLNAIATYIFWNVHEPAPGHYDFSGEEDLAAFVKMVQEEGMWVILRPGPYACAEWDFGGYPAWLLRSPPVAVRSRDPRFLAASARWLTRLGMELAPLQVTHGGPILMVQVENEYGSYGNDHRFMAAARDQLRQAGFDVPLFTADGPSQMPNGRVDGALPAINGATDSTIFTTIGQYRPHGPYFVAEFYPGWLDHWGEPHQRVPAAGTARDYEWMLSRGVSVNLYVFHGGTNFGFSSGANYSDHFQPQPTSYDYDAPLDESGRPTAKYFALRDVAIEHLNRGETVPEVPDQPEPISIMRFGFTERAELLTAAEKPVKSARPLAMEDLGPADAGGQSSGYALYRTTIAGAGRTGAAAASTAMAETARRAMLAIPGLRDYAVVFVDGRRAAELDRRHHQDSTAIALPAGRATLDILVENSGRINYGRLLPDNRKGITGPVTLDGRPLTGWTIYPLPLRDPDRASFARTRSMPAGGPGPALFRGTFIVNSVGDTFLDLRGWGKGAVWVNGHNLGRYWYIGPQQTLYLPGAWLRAGPNQIVVLDLGAGGLRSEVGGRTADLGWPRQLQGLKSPILDQLAPDRLAPPRPRGDAP